MKQSMRKWDCRKYYEDADKLEKLIDRQAVLQEKIDATDAWNLTNKLERAMDALRCPEPETPVSVLSGGERRRVALCRLVASSTRYSCYWMSRPTTSMPNRWNGSKCTCSNIREL